MGLLFAGRKSGYEAIRIVGELEGELEGEFKAPPERTLAICRLSEL